MQKNWLHTPPQTIGVDPVPAGVLVNFCKQYAISANHWKEVCAELYIFQIMY